MRGLLFLAGAAALTTAVPAWAGDASELAFVKDGYTAEQRSEIDRLVTQVDMLGDEQDMTMDDLGFVVLDSALRYSEKFGWGDDELQPAMPYELGPLLEIGFVRQGKLAASDIAKIDATLAKGDRTALWAAMEEQVGVGMSGEGDVGDGNAALFGIFLLETGIGLEDDKAELAGIYLGAKAMQRVSARQFVAAQ
jgi:hypothetical protein